MPDQPECKRCPAFLHSPESLWTGLCYGCRSPGPERTFPPAVPRQLPNPAAAERARIVAVLRDEAVRAVGKAWYHPEHQLSALADRIEAGE